MLLLCLLIEVFSECGLKSGKNLSVYFDKYCNECVDIQVKVEKLRSILEDNDIEILNIDCDKCSCDLYGIKYKPTLIYRVNKIELFRVDNFGQEDYEANELKEKVDKDLNNENLIDIDLKNEDIYNETDQIQNINDENTLNDISQESENSLRENKNANINIDFTANDNGNISLNKNKTFYENILDLLEINPSSEIKNLHEISKRDFGKLKYGIWIVFIQKKQKIDEYSSLINKFGDQINFAIINPKDTENTQMSEYSKKPTILSIYSGHIHKFLGDQKNLEKYIISLLKPVLSEITYKEYSKMKQKQPNYILFYKSKKAINNGFKKISNQFKFHNKFYKSNDQEFIDKAHIRFKSINKKVDPDDIVVLSVHKNGNMYHQLKITKFNHEKINDWIWSTQYPMVTQISTRNIERLMQGLKEIIILVDEKYLHFLEGFSEYFHKGKPFSDFIFAIADKDTLSDYLNLRIKKNNIYIYNPFEKSLKHIKIPEKIKIFTKIEDKNDDNNKNLDVFKDFMNETILAYRNKKLDEYDSYKFNKKLYIPIIVFIVAGLYFKTKQIHGKLCKND